MVRTPATLSVVASRYKVEVETTPAKQIQRLQSGEQARVMVAIRALADEPHPHGCVKMSGTGSSYRVRVGKFRVVYVVDDGLRVVTVTRVGHRKEVYNR
jgi:mRNA interferase RelE/StbE